MSTATAPKPDLQACAADPMRFFADTIIPGGGVDVRLGDVWADFQVDAFEVMADCLQAVAIGERPPFRGLWVERCKGASKDSDVGLALLWLLMFSRRPQTIELAADDFDQIYETSKAMQAVMRLNPWMEDRLEVQRSRIFCEATNSETRFLTRDSSGAHGSRPTLSVCNELSHCSDADFIATMMDNADKIPNNLAILATNAGELLTWQHRWRENYRLDPAWWFQKVDSVAPWIDPEKVADAQRRNPPSRFQRLWRGIWVSPGGDALSPDQIERCIVHDAPLAALDFSVHSFATIGCDCGLVMHHAAIVVLVGSHAQQKIRVAKVIDFAPPVRLESVRDEIVKQAKFYQARFVALDPWQMMRVAEELAGKGFRVCAQHQSGNFLTKQSAALLESIRDGVLQLYRGDTASHLLIEDLYGCRVVEKSYGNRLEYTENENGHSDRLAALAQVLPVSLERLGQPLLKPALPEVYERVYTV
jgi:hypothetical protein